MSLVGTRGIGIGMLIAALGLCFIVFNDSKIQLGLMIGIFLSSIIALAIPHALIGGYEMKNMACHRVAFPAITIESVIFLVFSAVIAVINEMKRS